MATTGASSVAMTTKENTVHTVPQHANSTVQLSISTEPASPGGVYVCFLNYNICYFSATGCRPDKRERQLAHEIFVVAELLFWAQI